LLGGRESPRAASLPDADGRVELDDGSVVPVSQEAEEFNRRLLRARDAMDRSYAEPLDVRAVAAVAHCSEAHFSRSFRAVFGETPHRYLQRRRVERSMFLLRETERSITDVCFDVGFMSLGTFSRTFREIIGETPSAYRAGNGPMVAPNCIQMWAMRPRVGAGEATPAARDATAAVGVAAPDGSPKSSRFGEARAAAAP
jgi:AraC-like DNA-binding protein